MGPDRMGNQHLEAELGRLSGTLESLKPTLEEIDRNERDNSNQLSTLKERVDGLRRDFDQLVLKVSKRLSDVFTRLGNAETEIARQRDRLKAIDDDTKSSNFGTRTGNMETKLELQDARIKYLEESKDGFGRKAWDIGKILITAAVTALITWYMGRK